MKLNARVTVFTGRARLDQQFNGSCVLLPHFADDERRINHDQIERAVKMSRKCFQVVEVVENKAAIRLPLLIVLFKEGKYVLTGFAVPTLSIL